ncbi:importin subunit alpha-4-like [Ananas comosus]|uniref:Importin subunit alpha n=1 Tax=Ananas comosus TaxID=4615 RepID=A0A6P5GSB6_ANACO|nr:importin subunit alpha-4-like [Ananas comosus]
MSLRPRTTTRGDARRRSYKAWVDAGEARRRREAYLLDLRRSKRHGDLLKRRRRRHDDDDEDHDSASPPLSPRHPEPRDHAAPDPPSPSSSPPPPPAAAAEGDDDAGDSELGNLPGMVERVWSDNPALQLEATSQFRRLLSIEKNPPIEEVIKAGVVPRFVAFLSLHELPQLQLEAAWALTNIAAGTTEHTQIVIKHGAVPKLVELLDSPRHNVRLQAVWALGNVAGDAPSCRNSVLEHGALYPLLSLFNEHARISMLRTATWTLTNLCRGRLPDKSQMKPILKILRQLINSIDENILADACWALCYLSGGTIHEIEVVVEAGVCPPLVKLLLHPSPNVLTPVILTIANITAGNDSQTEVIVENGVLPCLFQLLTHRYEKRIRKEACLTVSNITLRGIVQIQAVIEANIFSPLVQLLEHVDVDIKKEAAWAISNATVEGSDEQIRYLVSLGCVKPLCDLLESRDPITVCVCLNALDNILSVGESDKKSGKTGTNPYVELVNECGGLDKIENLQEFDNDEVYKKAIEVLESYWDEEDQNEAPIFRGSGVSSEGAFEFDVS